MDRSRIILINAFECAEGGGEQRTLHLANLLSRHAEVTLCPLDPGRAGALAGWRAGTMPAFAWRNPVWSLPRDSPGPPW